MKTIKKYRLLNLPDNKDHNNTKHLSIVKSRFESILSIKKNRFVSLDVLMFNSVEEVNLMLDQYELI
ncbi:MAG: hypothetical protein E6Q89_10025 [Bacteroidia bacterium]|nr:MAG: hypothetical protein E6Q89_10025 [Bacteroidia bacterium]